MFELPFPGAPLSCSRGADSVLAAPRHLYTPLGCHRRATALNLWPGLYSAPGEWPWTYFFLLVLMLIFALRRYGRSLGLDAIIVARLQTRGILGRILLATAT